MIAVAQGLPLAILIFGAVVILAILIKAGLERLSLPALIGFMALGFAVRLSDSRWGLLPAGAEGIFDFLADIGLICLLFRVGLESNLEGLLRQLRRATVVWVGDVAVSGLVGFAVSYYLLKLPLIPSLFVGSALTATSVGIGVRVWQERKALNTPVGELLLDVAEMDDLSGIVLMALLFAVAPVLHESGHVSLGPMVARTCGWVLAKLLAFGAVCFVFSRYAEKRLTAFSRRIERGPDPMITMVGIAFVVAAIASLMGFSVAIGAFFAGLVFSRDPSAVKMEASFDALYELFYPFFFVGIGMGMAPGSLTGAVGLGLALLAAGIVGKIVGAGTPTLMTAGRRSALLMSPSMIPRAEVAMVIMLHGRSMGDWAVPDEVFSGMALVSAVTCVLSPAALGWMLKRYPPEQ